MIRPTFGGPSSCPSTVCSIPLHDGITLHVDLDTAAAMNLARWLVDGPVTDMLERQGQDWQREEGRSFSRPGEIHRALGEAMAMSDRARAAQATQHERARLDASRHGDHQHWVDHMKTAGACEALATRLCRYLERALTGWHAERTPIPLIAFGGRTARDTCVSPDGVVARRTTIQVLLDTMDRAQDILGNIPGASHDVCLAYAELESVYWNVRMGCPRGDAELVEEWNLWLRDLVSLAYRESFDITAPDSHEVTRLEVDLYRPVTAGEVRAVLQNRIPDFIDQRRAIEVGMEPSPGPTT